MKMDFVEVFGSITKNFSVLTSLKVLVTLIVLNGSILAVIGKETSESCQNKQNANLQQIKQNINEYVKKLEKTISDVNQCYKVNTVHLNNIIKLLKNGKPDYNEVRKGLSVLHKELNLTFSNESVIRSDVETEKPYYTPDELVNEIIYLILNNYIQDAIKLLEWIQNDNYLYSIVNEVCKTNNENRYDLLIEFANLLANRNRASLIYIALSKQLLNTNSNYKYLAKITELIKNKVINNVDVETSIRNKAMKSIISLNENMKPYCLDYLKSLLIDKDIIDIEEGFNIINNIYLIDINFVESIFKDFLIQIRLRGEQIYDEIFNYLNILVINYSQCKSQHLLLQVINVFIVNSFDKIDSSTLFQLCNKYLLLEQTYKSKISEDIILRIRSKFEYILPYSIYNILFTEKQCIRNVGLDEYLSVNNVDLYDPSRRNVFTRSRNETDAFKEWKIKYENNKFKILTFNEFNENMYTSLGTFVGSRRVIWTWVPNTIDDTMDWNIEIFGDYVYIKSLKFNEYLYGSFKNSNVVGWKPRHVYTLYLGNNNCPENDCLWIIENCDQPYISSGTRYKC